jgi:hypothetical protein
MAAPATVTSVDLDGTNVGPDEVTAVDLTQLALIRAAIDALRLPLKVVALSLGVDQASLTRMLQGEKPFPLQKVDRLPDEVRRLYARLQAEREGWRVITESRRHSAIRRAIGQLLLELEEDFDPRLPVRANAMVKVERR